MSKYEKLTHKHDDKCSLNPDHFQVLQTSVLGECRVLNSQNIGCIVGSTKSGFKMDLNKQTKMTSFNLLPLRKHALICYTVLHERNMKTLLAEIATYGHTIDLKAVGNTP